MCGETFLVDDPEENARLSEYIGRDNYFSIIRNGDGTFSLRAHDEVTEGGLLLELENVEDPPLAWELGGNAGTDPAEHYAGTQDAAPFFLGTDGTQRAKVMAQVPSIQIASSPETLAQGDAFPLTGYVALGVGYWMAQFGLGSGAWGWNGVAVGGTPDAPDLPHPFSLMGATNGMNWNGGGFSTVCRMRYRNVAGRYGGISAGNQPTRIEFSTTRPDEAASRPCGTFTEHQRLGLGTVGGPGTGNNNVFSTLDVGGSLGAGITVSAAPVALDESHSTLVLTEPDLTQELPAPDTTPLAGNTRRVYNIKNGSAGPLTITGHIDGVVGNSLTIGASESRTFHCSGTTWWLV